MLTGLHAAPDATVVMDAGLATQANLDWLREQGHHGVLGSKLRERQFDPALATEVQSAGDVTIKLQRVLDAQGDVLLYCHSPAREEKDRAIDTAKASGLEAALTKLHASLSQPLARAAAIHIKLARLEQLTDDHFGHDPEDIHWGHVGDFGRVGQALDDLLAIFEGQAK